MNFSILMVALIFCLGIEPVIMAEPERQASQSVIIEKRATETKDLLSDISCRYLKTNRYLNSMPTLQKLCLKTFGCNDVISHKSCNIWKTTGVCTKNPALTTKYCKFTCNKCGSVPATVPTTVPTTVLTTVPTTVPTAVPATVPAKCIEEPLGMESEAIPDSSITASSFHPFKSQYMPYFVRLNSPKGKFGWAAAKANQEQWIQVDLGKATKVTGVATQGRMGTLPQWVKSYSLKYSDDGKTFKDYQGGKTFQGNTDNNTVVKHELVPPIVARYIRLYPKTWHKWLTMRMELYGCNV